MGKDKILKIISAIIILFVIIKTFYFIYSNISYFNRGFDFKFFGDLYSESQYVVGEKSEGGIGDDGLYAFAGYYYFFQKGDVSSVNFEHPPLGKYLIGLSVFLFGNENIISIIYYLFIIAAVYLIAREIQMGYLTSSLAVLFISLDKVMLDNLLRSLLDLPFTLFVVLAILFFIKGIRRIGYLIISNLFWGAAFSTRFFPLFAVIYPVLLAILIIYKKSTVKIFLLSSLLIPAVYLLSHLSFFIYHPSFMEFIRHKIWMLSWFKGGFISTGNILRNIFTGTYIGPTGTITRNEHWTIFLPLIFLLAVIRGLPVKGSGLKIKIFTLYALFLIFIIYAVFLTGGVQKFIMPIFPVMCVLAASSAKEAYSIITSWLKKRISLSGKKS